VSDTGTASSPSRASPTGRISYFTLKSIGRTAAVLRERHKVRSRHSYCWIGQTELSWLSQSGFDWSVKAIQVGKMRRWPSSWIRVIMKPRQSAIGASACHAR